MKKVVVILIIVLFAGNYSIAQKEPSLQPAPKRQELFDKMVATIDIPEVVKMLRNVKYNGMISFENERNMRDPFMGIAESIGYTRGIISATQK